MRTTFETFERAWTRLRRPHWERLRANGLAWVTAYDAYDAAKSATVAYAEVRCRARTLASVMPRPDGRLGSLDRER
ncbi:hypothetical protein [Streptomyces viridosporus]|uniref:hypothetical protein n=1 Tax=Streptomyces viridosporus TaxID=67581 RepID=UPI0036F6C1A5